MHRISCILHVSAWLFSKNRRRKQDARLLGTHRRASHLPGEKTYLFHQSYCP